MADALQLQVGGISCGTACGPWRRRCSASPGGGSQRAARRRCDGAAGGRRWRLRAAGGGGAAVEDAGKSCAGDACTPCGGSKGLELSRAGTRARAGTGAGGAEADDGAGVGFIKRQTSQVNVGVEGWTPKEVRIYGDVAASEAPAVALGDDELEDLDPQHAHAVHTLLDAATDATRGRGLQQSSRLISSAGRNSGWGSWVR